MDADKNFWRQTSSQNTRG